MLSSIEFHGWCQKKSFCELYVSVGISAIGEVWLTHKADAQFILEGGRRPKWAEKNFMFKFFLLGLKMWIFISSISNPWASLVAQWLRICLPMQGTRVRAPVWEDPTCRGAARPVSHNCWACASGACAPQRERPRQWEARALQWRVAPARCSWRKPSHRNEDPAQPKINK